MHKKYEVQPDISIFGKALGNGYAITAILGRKDIMDEAQSTFISSTFWTERIGPVAALKTLEIMERRNSWEIITKIGCEVKSKWQALADRYGLEIQQFGIPSLAGFSFKSSNALAYKTFITQEMLNKGYLTSNLFYACTEHTPEIIDEYFYCLEAIFEEISKCEDGKNIDTLLSGPVCHAGFKRLN